MTTALTRTFGVSVSLALTGMLVFVPTAWPDPLDKEFHKPAIPQSTQMIEAARRNDLPGVRAKLKAGARIDAQDGDGNTALHIAAQNGHRALAAFLVRSGADVSARNDFQETPLHVVRDEEVARMLLSHGADVNAKEARGMAPIFYQDLPITKKLVQAGADVNVKTPEGITPLMWYAYSNDVEGAKFLVSKGADVNAVTQDGDTALDIASRFHQQAYVEFLRSVNARSGHAGAGKNDRADPLLEIESVGLIK